MKRALAILAAAVTMSATVAFAAPATPVFNAAVKVGEGKIRTNNNRLAIDGVNIYAAYGTQQDSGSLETARIVSSANSGTTWGLSKILWSQADGASVDNLSVRVAVSNDPLYTGKKIVHAVWSGSNPADGSWNLFYAYKADRPTLVGWSTPVPVLTNAGDAVGTSLMVTSSGSIHIVSGSSYLTAASPDSPFIVSDVPVPVGSWVQAVRDSAGNIYAASTDGTTISLTKKSSSSSAWSTPVPVITGSVGGDIGLAVADANTYYVAYFDGTNSCMSVTTNGGKTWTKRIVGPVQTNPWNWPTPVVAVTSTKVITYATEVFDASGLNPVIKVYRSSDNGATWSAPATIKGQGIPTITLDSSNKAHILVRDEVGESWDFNPNLLWIREK